MSKLTPKQAKFVDEYLIDLNATQAAIRAGYSKKTAGQIGEQNLKKLEIQKAIQEAQSNLSERTKITQDYVLSNLKKVVDRCMQAEAVENAFTVNADGEMAQIYAFKENGALKGLELLGKHLGMFKEQVEHSGQIGINTLSSLMDELSEGDD